MGPEPERFEFRGEMLTIKELAARAGVPVVTMRDRLKRSHCATVEEAVSKEFHKRSDAPRYEYEGRSLPLREWAKIAGLSVECLGQRMRDGMTFAEAITKRPVRKSDQARQMTALRMAAKEAAE
ncbi:hypothetical protein A1351_14020 [Methylosinus sp. R-45379]|nr:hypothetical protein A1351_14020 [Methylosinus sp. R-45379]